MKRFWRLVWALAAVGLVAAERVPVEDFARSPLASRMALSPDSQYVAFLREADGRQTLFLSDLKTRQLRRVRPADSRRALTAKDVPWFCWVGDRRLAYETLIWDHFVTGVSALDCDGRRWKTISGVESRIPNEDRLYARTVIRVCDDADQSVLMLDQHEAAGEEILYPDVVKVYTITGHYRRVARNPGNVVAWGADAAGVVRVGITIDGLKPGAIYRENETAPWKRLAPPPAAHGSLLPVAMEGMGPGMYVSALTVQQRRAVYTFDAARGTLGDVLLDDPEYDILPGPDGLMPDFDGIPLARAVVPRSKHRLTGVYFLTEKPRVRWFDPEAAAEQRALDRALPDTFNVIVDGSRDGRRLLVLAFSDRSPGVYYLYDLADKSLTLVATRMGWLKPEQMAPMLPIEYRARDGHVIHGYVTPPGAARQHVPLVVLPHGGPWVRDAWGFDPLVQMLASRGYAVLQVNYRGSTGYGKAFHELGRREVGHKIQDDIEDGTRWAVAQGLADPKRIAIVGSSFGGYSALFALGHNPDLYRCGVSISGVTDWPAIYERLQDPERAIARRYWTEMVGDPKADEADLRAISPVNFADRITAPVLLIQGQEDHIVPSKQARAMIAALERAGHKPESLYLANEGHALRTHAARVEAFQRIAAFLAQHL